MGHQPVVDAMYRDGFLDPLCGQLWARRRRRWREHYGISREEQDAFAAADPAARCEAARDAGRFADEIVPVEVAEREGTRSRRRRTSTRATA